MSGIVVKPRARIFHGHDWVYGTEIAKVFGDPKPGDVISMKDFRDRPLGTAIYNPASQIAARRISRRKEDLTLDFFQRRLRRALTWREQLEGVDPKLARLVWSEADGLPGVVVDRYHDVLVVQTLTLAMDQRMELLVEALRSVFEPRCIIERNDSPMRLAEGLEVKSGVLWGEPPGAFAIETAGGTFTIDPLAGQKTGLYLDQLHNYDHVAKRASGKRVLDCFTNQGGFALACAKAGAASVVAVDVSEEAVAATLANAVSSGVAECITGVAANVFDFLKAAESAARTFDLIILDPPSFTRNKKSVNDALRGYKEIHLRAMKLLDSGGILSTYCCSHHVDAAEFRAVICEAAVDAKRTLRLLGTHGQRMDHPVLPGIPETEYLKGFTFEMISAW